MPKIQKTVPLEKTEPLENLEDSDNDSNLEAPIIQPPIKPVKRTINISDEERNRRRETMLKVREKKMEKVQERTELKNQFLRQQEDEINSKVLKKAELMKKQNEKKVLQNLIRAEISKGIKPTPQSVAKQTTYQPQQQPSIRFI